MKKGKVRHGGISQRNLEQNKTERKQAEEVCVCVLRMLRDGERKRHIIPLLKVIRTFIKKFGKGKALTNTSHLLLFCSPPSDPPTMWVCVCVCVALNLRQHGILPPPGHADCEQVIDRGGILQAGLASLGLVWQATDHCLPAGLDEQRC